MKKGPTPLSLPTPDNDYAAPANMTLNKASWDAAMTSIGERLRAREALEASFQNLINLGVGQAIAAVQNEIAPTAAQAQAHAQQIEAFLDALLATSIPATLISVTPSMRFTSDAEIASKASASALADLVAAVALLAPRASPNFTGSPTAPTPAGGDNSAKLATTAFVKTAIAALVASAPGVLDTLDELAAAFGDDANFASTVTSALAARLRFDAAQALSAGEKTQARTNLGLGSLATQSAVNPADLPAGAWVHLATLTANNSAALQVTSSFTSAYDEYEIEFVGLKPSSASAVGLGLQLHSGGAYHSANYDAVYMEQNSIGYASGADTGQINLSAGARMSNAASDGLCGSLRLYNVNSATKHPRVSGVLSFHEAYPTQALIVTGGRWNGGFGVTGIQAYANSGNLADGAIHIRARKK
ncbi:MAG: bacteriophage tail fiber protein [Methylocystaceae bacterium]|nr:MAG: bacteriophage tail fiber protein [Methylocystaceae bacterium]KAF0213950.1 MAG: bacteriophage tail fiber [Methylocystaceae bacterium]TXT46855.1 MAG: bacteriophage tail fiber protein [Methylocystaceae bacterium]